MNAALRTPLPGVAMKGAARSDVLLLCSDDALLIELAPLLGDRYRVHAIDTPDRIGEQVEVARWIGIVDVDSLPGANGVLSRLEAQYPRCPLILITARPESWVGSIACAAVLAAIGRNQIATGRLGEVLLAAEDRLSSPALESVQAGESSAISVIPEHFERSLRQRRSLWVGAAGLALMLALGISGAWLYIRHTPARHSPVSRGARTSSAASPAQLPAAAPAAAVGAPPAAPAAPAPQSVLELLSAARIAFRDQRLLPQQLDGALNGDSALELYVQVLRQDPQNDEALAGVKRLLAVGGNRLTTDVAGGQLDDATRLLNVFRTAGVTSSDLQQWANAISAAQPKWLAQRAAQTIATGDFKAADELIAQAAGSGADAATVNGLRSQESAKKLDQQLKAMARQVNAAIESGALLPPAAENARARLAAMRSLARNNPLTLQTQLQVQDALVQQGEQATRAARFDSAERDLSAAAELGSSTLLTLARRQLQAARAAAAARAVRVAALVAPRPASPTSLAVPPIASAATTAASAAAFIAARPTRPLAGNYPPDANGEDGSVVVEFTLSANGKASNPTVVQSDPPGIFDREAIRMVRNGRYSTTDLVNHRPARARIKVRFTPG